MTVNKIIIDFILELIKILLKLIFEDLPQITNGIMKVTYINSIVM